MPSLHVAWALWCTVAVSVVRQDRRARMVAAGYAAVTVVVAMATANHYFLDVVAGAATAAVAAGVAVWHGRRRTVHRPRRQPGGLKSAATGGASSPRIGC
jgi:membrane-associated phospholipid phosphatase